MGEIAMRSCANKQGVKNYVTEVIGESITLVDKKEQVECCVFVLLDSDQYKKRIASDEYKYI